MSLENVKVNDWVWMSERKRRATTERVRPFRVTEVFSLHTFRISTRPIDEFRKRDGSCVKGRSEYFISAIATSAEVAAWQADAEAAEREREQAREEKRGRMARLAEHLEGNTQRAQDETMRKIAAAIRASKEEKG